MQSMELTEKQITILGLSTREERIMRALEKAPRLTTSSVARSSRVPRTTVQYILGQFRTRGIVRRIHVGGHQEWKIADLQKLFRHTDKSRLSTSKHSADIEITTYKGRHQIMQAYEKTLELGRAERAYVIQGNGAARASINWEFVEFIRKFKKAHIIVEAVGGEEVLELLRVLEGKKLRARHGRMIIAHLLPDTHMDFDIDAVFFHDAALFVNIKEKEAVFIRNEPIANMFRNIFFLLQSQGKKIDLNAYIQSIIADKSAN